ncbi:MAG: response regulator [Desulfobacteraceae bacterium]|nr:response regulator [Desulfobacteraceae bacterium]
MKNKDKLFLIVDDEPDMCWALEQILKKNGCLSKKTLNGKSALKLVRENRFQLAFLDAKLPDIEGLELARQIREIDPSLRIIIVSGYFYKDDIGVQKALADGFISGFISKPFNHDEIVRNIRT